MKRRIMVTGCDGFIGRAVTQKLLALGHDVLGVGRRALAPGYQCDLSDADAVKRTERYWSNRRNRALCCDSPRAGAS